MLSLLESQRGLGRYLRMYVHHSRLSSRGSHPTSNESAQTCSDGIFDHADLDKSGHITLDEYLAYTKYTHKGSLTEVRDLIRWIRYFHSFDRDEDEAVSLREVMRA